MRTLRPIIDRFIDDVLRAVRGATVRELEAWFASPSGAIPTALKPAPIGRRQGTRSPSRAVTRSLEDDAVSEDHDPAPEVEISDPERLWNAISARRPNPFAEWRL